MPTALDGGAAWCKKGGSKKGGSKRGAQKGVLANIQRSGETASGACDSILRGVGGQCTEVCGTAEQWPVWYGRIYRVLTAFCNHMVLLPWYSHGTALPRRARGTPSWSCGSRCRTHWAAHGSPGHPSVGFLRHGTVEYSQGTHRVLTGYSQGTHTGSGSDGPVCNSAWAWAHGTQCSACVRHHGVYFKVGERHRTEGDLACDARRVLTGYSRAEYRVHRRSALVRAHCGGCLIRLIALRQTLRVRRVRSADTRADQRRRHQPADARADDLCTHARADLIADVFRRCAAHIHSTEPFDVAGPVPWSDSTVLP
jgi:hypothetical protein